MWYRRGTLLSFDVEQARRGAYSRRDGGAKTVAVECIRGSVGRAGELDRRFRRRRGSLHAPSGAEIRMQRVRQLFKEGRVPPVELYQIGDDYFVVDGHHRVAVALERGQEFLEARVVEHLPDRRDPANRVFYERLAFVGATGLEHVHAREPDRYRKLLNRVRDYHHAVLAERQPGPHLLGQAAAPPEPLTLRDAARDWFEAEYLPVTAVLRAERLPERFNGSAMGDLFGYVCDHRWFMSERRGWDVGIDAALVDFVHRNAREPLAEALLDSIRALGSETLDERPRLLGAGEWIALAAGLVAVPIAFLRGLRPRHYRFPWAAEGT